MADLRFGRWQDVLTDVECDAIIADPPYGAKTHAGHNTQTANMIAEGKASAATRTIDYAHMTPEDAAEQMGRRAVGAECDADAYAEALVRLDTQSRQARLL